MTFARLLRPDLLAIARRHAADRLRWPVSPRFDPTDRWYARIAAAADHEVWLLTWLPGQETDLHDHGGSAGAFVVVAGALTEQTVSGGRLVDAGLPAGTYRRFGASHVHRVRNTGSEPAISVHAYGPALRTMTRYELVQGRLRVAEVATAGRSW